MILKKSHPKSYIRIVHGSGMTVEAMLLSETPRFKFCNCDENGNYDIPIVVLQVESINEKDFIVEFVKKSDYKEASQHAPNIRDIIHTAIYKIEESNPFVGNNPKVKWPNGLMIPVEIIKVTPLNNGFAIIEYKERH